MPLRDAPLPTPDVELTPSDVPAEVTGHNDAVVKAFCQSFDGYGYWGSAEVCGRIGRQIERELGAGQSPRDLSLTRLRTYAFFVDRRSHMADAGIDYERLGVVFAAIAEKLGRGDGDHAETMIERMGLLNRALLAELVERMEELPAAAELSAPLLLRVPAGYPYARVKVLVVGQETSGWGPKGMTTVAELAGRPVEEIANGLEKLYDDFLGARKAKPGGRPFFRGVKRILGYVGQLDYAWSNVWPCDQGRKPPQDQQLKQWLLGLRVLAAQVRILEPSVVIFLTGPTRDEVIKELFSGATFEPLRDQAINKLARVTGADALPVSTYRTYHPKHLRLAKQWTLLDLIGNDIIDDPRAWDLHGPDEPPKATSKPALPPRKGRFVDDGLKFIALSPRGAPSELGESDAGTDDNK